MTVYRDRDGFEYEATLFDPHPDDPDVITERDMHPLDWED